MIKILRFNKMVSCLILLMIFMPLVSEETNGFQNLLKSNQLNKLQSELSNASDSYNTIFYREKLKTKVVNSDNYEKILKNSINSVLNEKALLEAVEFKFIKRNYKEIINLINVSATTNIELIYWKALANYKSGNFASAIKDAQKIIKDGKDYGLSEISYILIADSYIKMKEYRNAISSLNELKNSPFINHIPIVHLKTAECCINLHDFDLAAGYLKKIIKDYPFSQYSIQAEEMYTCIIGKVNETITVKDPIIKKQPEQVVKHFQPQKDNKDCIYLQTGAFSAKKNAEKQLKSLQNMGYPGILATKTQSSKSLYLVRIGPFTDKAQAKTIKEELDLKSIKSFYVN